MIQCEPLFDNVLIELDVEPTFGNEEPVYKETGIVKAIGSDVKHIKVGDWIGIFPFPVRRIEIEGQRFHLIPEHNTFTLAKFKKVEANG